MTFVPHDVLTLEYAAERAFASPRVSYGEHDGVGCWTVGRYMCFSLAAAWKAYRLQMKERGYAR